MRRALRLFRRRDAAIGDEEPPATPRPECYCSDGNLRKFNTRRLFRVIEKLQSEQDMIDEIGACLENRADVNGQNDTGHTVLHIAEQKSYPSVVEFLLGRGGVRADTAVGGDAPRPHTAPDTSHTLVINNPGPIEVCSNRFTDLIIDKTLKFGCPNYIDSLKTVTKDAYSIEEKLNLDPYPSDRTLALLALKVYSDNPDDKSQPELPGGWKLLTTARNPAQTNGYFGAAFWCPAQLQVVVAHRGTAFTNAGALWTDFKSVYWNKETSHVSSAVTFTAAIATALSTAKREGVSFQLSITGHSLGGWLAQVTAFTVKYLQKDEVTFRKLTDIKDGTHAHAVAFESPGCKTMLSKMKAKFDQKCDRLMVLKKLDITSYLSAPNHINTVNLHLGTVYRIITDLSDVTRLHHTSITHSMEKMLKAMENPSTFSMLDWPKSKVEYNEYQERATPDNEFHPQSCGYVFKEIDRNCCSSRIFSEDELLLLDAWMVLKKSSKNLTNLSKIEGLTVSDLFDEFKVDKEKQTVTCSSEESVQKVVRHTKALARWLPAEVMAATRQQAALVPSAAEAMFRAEADNYLRSLRRSRLDFRDALELEAFLTFGSNILIIRTSDSDAEMARLVNVLQQIEKKRSSQEGTNNQYIFMNLEEINRLESAVNIQGLFRSSFEKGCVFFVRCSEKYDTNCETILKEILKNLKNNQNKLIFVEPRDTGFEKVVKLFNVFQQINNPHILKHSEEINLNDLTEASLETVFKQKIILLQGERLSLRDLVGDYRRLTADQRNGVNTSIGPQMLKNLLTTDNYAMEIQDALLDQDDLKVHSTFNRETSVTRVARALQEHSSDALLVISGIGPEELRTDRWRELVLALGEERISTTKADGESIFKRMCREKPDSAVYWLAASAGLVSCKSIYLNGFYMKRRFHKIIFNIEQFARNINRDINIRNATFVFRTTKDKQSLMSQATISDENKKIILETKHVKAVGTAEQADGIIKEISDGAVHILEPEANSGLILWQRSRGSLEGLRPYVSTCSGESVDEEGLRNTRQKVVIIADEPGMGKSTSLTSVSRLLRASAWVIRVDLKDHKIPHFPSELSLNLISDFILRDSDSWLRGLLQFCLNKEQENSRAVYIFFDGFDEIKRHSSTQYSAEDQVLRLLKYLHNETTARVWVTTRVYRAEKLENALSAVAMRFEMISEPHQREYLSEFWHPHMLLELDQYGDAEKKKLEECAGYVFENAKEVLGADVQNFMGIPLQMRMLAEVFRQRVRGYLDPETGTQTDIRNTFNVESVFDLYQQFISIKYDIYFTEKTSLDAGMSDQIKQSTVEQLTEKHRLLALRTLFPEFAINNFDAPEAGWGDELCRVGLVRAGGGGGDNSEFIHRTLAEYFCADLAVHWLRRRGRYHGLAPVMELLLTEILLRDAHKVIRTFIDKLVLSQPLAEDADRFSALQISALWCDEGKQRSLFNKYIGTALRIAVGERNTGIIAILVGGLKWAPVPEGLISFIAAHDRNRYTALGRAAREAGNEEAPETARRVNTEIMKEFVHSVENCPHEVILELLLATYSTIESNREMTVLSEYVRGKVVCPAIYRAFTRTQEVIRDHIPRLRAAVRTGRVGEVRAVYGSMESDTERRGMLLVAGGEREGTVLHDAIRGEKHKVAAQIIIILCDQNIPQVGRSYDGAGQTPLHRAAEAGRLDIVEHFINHGVHIGSLTRQGVTALFPAVWGGSLPVVQYLVKKGLDITTVDTEGKTALFPAAWSGSLPVVQYLVKKGLDITTVDTEGETALFPAAQGGSLPVVQYLVEEGLDITTANTQGETALDIAKQKKYKPIIEFLKQKPPPSRMH